jgi:hypothetical protein
MKCQKQYSTPKAEFYLIYTHGWGRTESTQLDNVVKRKNMVKLGEKK